MVRQTNFNILHKKDGTPVVENFGYAHEFDNDEECERFVKQAERLARGEPVDLDEDFEYPYRFLVKRKKTL